MPDRCICPFCEERPHTHPCGEPVTDGRWGPWCTPCNDARFARIDAGFRALLREEEAGDA